MATNQNFKTFHQIEYFLKVSNHPKKFTINWQSSQFYAIFVKNAFYLTHIFQLNKYQPIFLMCVIYIKHRGHKISLRHLRIFFKLSYLDKTQIRCLQDNLTILTGKNCCFPQFSTRMTAWLLLTFFICLHIQLSSMHSITTY